MNKRLLSLGLILALAALLPLGTAGADKKKQDGISKEQADAILKELQAIRQLLEQQQRANPPRPAGPAQPAKLKVSVAGPYILGRADAPLTIVEFTDYQCPYCRRFHTDTFAEFKKKYIDTGQVRFISRDLPLVSIHPNAMRAAQAGRCAGEQGKFWEMRDVLINNAAKLAAENLTGYAQGLGLNMDVFNACLASEKYAAEVQKDVSEADSVGIDGTPTFVLGATTADSTMEGVKLVGAQPLGSFDAQIKRLLPAGPPSPTGAQ